MSRRRRTPPSHQPQTSISHLSDREIVDALIARDAEITKLFLYEKCYPLFKSVYNKYETDCIDCIEFINQIYLHIMVKSSRTGLSKLESFGFNCTLTNWLKIVIENYCHQIFKKKSRLPIMEKTDGSDSLSGLSDSIGIDLSNLDINDLNKLLGMMRNGRYRQLIIHRYVEGHTNEETAELLGMNMNNYYNKHRLAKKQFLETLKKEGLK